MQKCCVCGKVLEGRNEHPNAKVAHMACAMAAAKPQRDKQQHKDYQPYNKWEKK